jgi:hypothetical protein
MYNVVVLAEQTLSPDDASRVLSLHEGLDEPVGYFLLIPVEDSAARVQAALGVMGSGDPMGIPTPQATEMTSEVVNDLEKEARTDASEAVTDSVKAFQALGATVSGESVLDAVESLAAKIKAVDGQEAIVLTAPHVVAEFFHVDWSSKARRSLGVPVLHLLEHETFDAQADDGLI